MGWSRCRVLVDKNDAARWRWISEPFGTTQPEQAPAGLSPITFNLRFPGQYYDSESGLSYNYFRDYDGTSGRYVQSDALGLDGGFSSTYAYANANPTAYTDALGLAAAAMNSSNGSGPGGGGNCDCAELKKNILRKYALLLAELRAYDPVLDGRGGFPMRGGKLTKPGGHYKEIGDLQNGINNDFAKYNRECKGKDDGGGGTWVAIPRSIDRDANRPVAPPIISPAPTPNPQVIILRASGIAALVLSPYVVVPTLLIYRLVN